MAEVGGSLGKDFTAARGAAPAQQRPEDRQGDRWTEGSSSSQGAEAVLGWPPCSVGAELSDPEPSFQLAADLQRSGFNPFRLPVSLETRMLETHPFDQIF